MWDSRHRIDQAISVESRSRYVVLLLPVFLIYCRIHCMPRESRSPRIRRAVRRMSSLRSVGRARGNSRSVALQVELLTVLILASCQSWIRSTYAILLSPFRYLTFRLQRLLLARSLLSQMLRRLEVFRQRNYRSSWD